MSALARRSSSRSLASHPYVQFFGAVGFPQYRAARLIGGPPHLLQKIAPEFAFRHRLLHPPDGATGKEVECIGAQLQMHMLQ